MAEGRVPNLRRSHANRGNAARTSGVGARQEGGYAGISFLQIVSVTVAKSVCCGTYSSFGTVHACPPITVNLLRVSVFMSTQSVEYLGVPSLDGKTTTTVRSYTPHKKNGRSSDGLVGALVYIHGGVLHVASHTARKGSVQACWLSLVKLP